MIVFAHCTRILTTKCLLITLILCLHWANGSIRCEKWGKTMKCMLGSNGIQLSSIYSDEISELDFADCNLRFLDPTWLKQFPKLSIVHLSGNQLDCSCYARRKINEFLKANVLLFGHCAFPPEWEGLPLQNLTQCDSVKLRRNAINNDNPSNIKDQSLPGEAIYGLSPIYIRDASFNTADPLNPPKLIAAFLNRNTRIDCAEISHTTNDKLIWIKNGEELQSNNRIFALGQKLILHRVNYDDYGLYKCINNSTGSAISFRLQVVGSPMTRFDRRVYFPFDGTDLELHCQTKGFPQPQISWFRNDNPLNPSHGLHYTLIGDGSRLIIMNVKHNRNAGQYKCVATNEHGQSTSVCEVQVINPEPPRITDFEKGSVVSHTSANVELCCKHSGSPQPTVQWLFNSTELSFDGSHYVLSTEKCLLVQNVSIRDHGTYECVLSNMFGSDRKETYLRVLDPRQWFYYLSDLNKLKHEAILQNNNQTLAALQHVIAHQAQRSVDGIAYWLMQRDNEALISHNLEHAERYFRFVMFTVRDLLEKVDVVYDNHTRFAPTNASEMRPDYNAGYNGLSALHVHRLAEMTGCVPHQLIPKDCTSKCTAYRSADGTCNNLVHKMWGASQTPHQRWLSSQYENNFNLPKGWNESKLYNGYSLPSPRTVSFSLISTNQVQPDSQFSHMLMQWGQFVDHDFTHTLMMTGTHEFSDARLCVSSCTKEAPCFPIRIPHNDKKRQRHRGNCIEFIRSTDVCFTGETSFLGLRPIERQQINQITSYLDASNVYGSTEQELHDLREHSFGKGLLKMRRDPRFPKRMLPFAVDTPVDCQRDRDARASPVGCFLAGDHRASEQLGLIAMHTIWTRQHNRIAEQLSELNHDWSPEQVFQEARKIVGAQQQIITFNHWLPLIVGSNQSSIPAYNGYDNLMNSQTANVVATAAFRFGHSIVNPIVYRLNSSLHPIPQGNLLLRQAFFAPWRILEEGGVDPLLRGMYAVPTKLKVHGEIVNSELTEHLFHIVREISQDLAALNIQRGRDHGLPAYVDWRRFCGLSVPSDFEDLENCAISDKSAIRKLKEVYGSVKNIDLWVGGILEDTVPNGKVGPLFRCLIVKQFIALRDGDRFWYENPGQFTKAQMTELRKTSLSKIICENADNIKTIPKNVFRRSIYPQDYLRCSLIEDVNVAKAWKNCCQHNVLGNNGVCNKPSIHSYNPFPNQRQGYA